MFQPRASDKTKGNGIAESNGLGLSISQRIAKSLGGDLTYLNSEVGSHFKLQVQGEVLETIRKLKNTQIQLFKKGNDESNSQRKDSLSEFGNSVDSAKELDRKIESMNHLFPSRFGISKAESELPPSKTSESCDQ